MRKIVLLILGFLIILDLGCAPTQSDITSKQLDEKIKRTKVEEEEYYKRYFEEKEKRDSVEINRLNTIKYTMQSRGYMTIEELQEVIDLIHKKPNETRDIFAIAIDKNMLPFRAMFYLSLEKENYDEAELIRMSWISCLYKILSSYGTFLSNDLIARIQLEIKKLEIVGLTDPMLINLRKELAVVLRDKKWDDAQKIQNIITARVKELTPPPQPQIQVIEKIVERQQVVGSGGQTTVVIQQPDKIQVEQLPRYGVSDYGRVLSIIGGKPISSKDAATLKLFDMLTGR
jgi:hypothetical protein